MPWACLFSTFFFFGLILILGQFALDLHVKIDQAPLAQLVVFAGIGSTDATPPPPQPCLCCIRVLLVCVGHFDPSDHPSLRNPQARTVLCSHCFAVCDFMWLQRQTTLDADKSPKPQRAFATSHKVLNKTSHPGGKDRTPSHLTHRVYTCWRMLSVLHFYIH